MKILTLSVAFLTLFLAGCSETQTQGEGSPPIGPVESLETPGTPDAAHVTREGMKIERDPSQGGDPDIDGDSIPDNIDNCPTLANLDQSDTDQDEVGDACDGN